MKRLLTFLLLIKVVFLSAQNPLLIPPLLTGTNFNLTIKDSTIQFWPGITTNTYGINGRILAPTLQWNKGDVVTMNVSNQLAGNGNSTTIHWHGLHVPAKFDGGPHQIINQGSTWSPSFQVMNQAGTFWYHPHGLNKTDRHVSKGVAGFIIVKDTQEAQLNLPRTYGVDDFPLVLQTKEFDVLHQIAIATFMDTAVMVNATVNPFVDLPAQWVRLRLLNGASQRTFQLGFSNNMNFYLIGNDAGLLDAPQSLNRLLLSNGERAEIMVDLSTMLNDTVYMKCFGSELPNGIYGADSVGDAGLNQITDYYNNSLNGADFNLLKIHVVAQTTNPVLTVPNTLIPLGNLAPDASTVYRSFVIDTISEMAVTPNLAMGPFAFNHILFDMDSINEVVQLHAKEVWTIHNKTMIAHPFHIHDVSFRILDINGIPPPAYEKGWKDVVLVMPGDSVRFIAQYEDFTDDSIPYMYHCHILHHEDDGMMGSFVVVDSSLSTSHVTSNSKWVVYPNPAHTAWTIFSPDHQKIESMELLDFSGRKVKTEWEHAAGYFYRIENSSLTPGMYFLRIRVGHSWSNRRVVKE